MSQELFATGQMGGGGAAPNAEKPAIAITAPFLGVLGVNGADAKGLDNLNATSLTGKDLFKAPDQGGQAILSVSSKPDSSKASFMQKIMQSASADLNKMNNENSPKSSSSGGGGSATASSGGGSSGGAPASRGGSGDSGLASAIASLQGGGGLAPMQISAPVPMHQDFTPTAPAQTPQVAAADTPTLG